MQTEMVCLACETRKSRRNEIAVAAPVGGGCCNTVGCSCVQDRGGWDARAADGDSLVAVFDGLVAVFGVVVLRSWKRSSSSVYTYE